MDDQIRHQNEKRLNAKQSERSSPPASISLSKVKNIVSQLVEAFLERFSHSQIRLRLSPIA